MGEKAKQTILLHVHFLDFLDFILFFFAKIYHLGSNDWHSIA